MIQRLQRHRYSLLLGLVLLLAAGSRFYGFTWGRPYALHVDEAYVIHLVYRLGEQWARERSLNPHASSYGALPLYLLLLAHQVASLVVARLGGRLGIDSAPLLYVGRLISATLGTATVGLIYELGKQVYGRAAGLLGATFLTLAVLAMRDSHFYTADTMLTFLVTLTVWLGVWVMRRRRWRNVLIYGVGMGLAISTKIVAVLLIVPLLVAAAVSGERRSRNSLGTLAPLLMQAMACMGAGLALALLVWLLLNPYAVLDYGDYFNFDQNDDLLVQSAVVWGTLRPLYTLQFAGTPRYLYVITNWLRWGLGLPLESLTLAGLVYALFEAGRGVGGDWLVLAWLGPYFLVAGSWYAKFIRYALPLLPFLCLLGGRLVADLYRKAKLPLARAAVVLLAVVVLLSSLFYTLAYLNIYARPDTRLQALRWMQQHIPKGATILVEKDAALHFEKLETMYGIRDYHLTVLDHYNIDGVKGVLYHAPAVSEERKRAFIQGKLNTEYIVLSDSWMERFLRQQDEYPVEAEFYEALFSGEAGYELVATFESRPRLGPWTINDDAAELTFRLFDHPKVYILHRFAGG